MLCENMDSMVQFLFVYGNRDLSKRTLRLLLTFEEYADVEIAQVLILPFVVSLCFLLWMNCTVKWTCAYFRLEKVVHPQCTMVARSAFVSLSRCLEPAVLRCQSSSALSVLFLLLNRWKLYALSSEQCSSFVVSAASLLRALTDEYSTRLSSADHLLRTK